MLKQYSRTLDDAALCEDVSRNIQTLKNDIKNILLIHLCGFEYYASDAFLDITPDDSTFKVTFIQIPSAEKITLSVTRRFLEDLNANLISNI